MLAHISATIGTGVNVIVLKCNFTVAHMRGSADECTKNWWNEMYKSWNHEIVYKSWNVWIASDAIVLILCNVRT